ncbi:hypothetical protein [Rhizobium jaguaris]|uniref:Uncharacterized protein n=1 Tax=Rhizobium jaguaris TaxID=1312183 RepID=A0A387G853_9HYPH|nr:hypothetical protein [Rhizobium jaguaris]AYG64041.1 hypothetical protein CCGE525_35080 [Rhizobium jaguaris]
MAKSVSLETGRTFATITSAKQHFAPMLDRNDLKQPFSGGDLADIAALYRDYCAKTNWPLPSSPTSFYPTYERDEGYTTRCFGVTFANGSIGRFSLDKALRAIAV